MKTKILLSLFIAISLSANTEETEFKDKPIFDFKDSDYQCTQEQLQMAEHHFSKCYGTPVFKDCYLKAIDIHCDKKWL